MEIKLQVGYNSPTDTLKTDLANALYNGTGLGTLNKLVLVDNAGNERDNSTSLSFIDTSDGVKVSATITASGSYTISRVRLYSTKLYYDTSLSSPVSVNSGDSVAVEVTLKLTLSGTLSGYSLVLDQIHLIFRDILKGAKTASALNVSKVELVGRIYGTNEPASLNITVSKNISGKQVTWSGNVQSGVDLIVDSIVIWAGSTQLYFWSATSPITVFSGQSITFSETFTA